MRLKKHLEKKYDSKEKMAEFLKGYEEFKLGVMLKEERKKAKMTQSQIAEIMGTCKEAISRLENHSENMNIDTLMKYAAALGMKVKINLEKVKA
jgi:HTH-type transcriptional regulator / antitoxin HipB